MASQRLASSPALRTATRVRVVGAPAVVRRHLHATAAPAAQPRLGAAGPLLCSSPCSNSSSLRRAGAPHPRLVRWSSDSVAGSKLWTFEEIQNLNADPSSSPSSKPKVTLVDAREPGELQQSGHIPGAVNIPITSAPDSFHITADEFEDRFGFERPSPDDEVVFYCKAGVRSRAAAGIAREAGWKKVGEYPGSWVDWAAKGGKVERS